MATVPDEPTHKPKSTRSRASIACTICRRRKMKCNVQSMTNGEPCTLCKSIGEDCVVKNDDNRKINASKKYVRQLEERIESLESFLKTVGSSKADLTAEAPTGDSIVRTEPDRFSPVPETRIPAGDPDTNMNAHGIRREEDTDNALGAVALDSQPQTMIQNPPPLATVLDFNRPHPDIFGKPTQFINQFSRDQDVDLLHFDTDQGSHDLMVPGNWSNTMNTIPMEMHSRMPLTVDDSYEFRVKYLDKLWKFQETSASMVEEDLFMAEHEKGVRSPYYSTFTVNSMLAFALCLDKEESVRPLGRVFADRSKSEIFSELENPNLATVLGFCFLSDYECINGSENLGWHYVGIACRLVTDLGLHQDCTDLVAKGYMSKVIAIARQRVTFGVFVYEAVWSMFLGRPASMKASQFYLPRMSSLSSDYQIQLLSTWVGLGTLMSKMVSTFSRPNLNDGKTLRKLKSLDEGFKVWQNSLPSKLRWTDSDQTSWAPGVCALYMQYCNTQILLHRTITANRERLIPPGFSETDMSEIWPYSLESSQEIMYENAVRIARALEMCRIAFEEMGFATLMLDIIFTAASTLITCMTTRIDSKTALKDHKWLMCLLEACESLQVHYPVANRMLAVLNSLMESTGFSKYIWRGPSAPPISNSTTATPTSNSDLGTPPPSADQYSMRSGPFELKRWCQNRGPAATVSSLPDPPHVEGGGYASFNISESGDTCQAPLSPGADSLACWNQISLSPLNWQGPDRSTDFLHSL